MSKITEFGIKSALKCFKKAKRNKDFFWGNLRILHNKKFSIIKKNAYMKIIIKHNYENFKNLQIFPYT